MIKAPAKFWKKISKKRQKKLLRELDKLELSSTVLIPQQLLAQKADYRIKKLFSKYKYNLDAIEKIASFDKTILIWDKQTIYNYCFVALNVKNKAIKEAINDKLEYQLALVYLTMTINELQKICNKHKPLFGNMDMIFTLFYPKYPLLCKQ